MTDVNFLRHDLFTTSSTARHCLRVLSAGKKSKQKVVVGDSAGLLQAFSLGKSQELISSFKIFADPMQAAISAIDLSNDKIFAAAGSSVSGISRKGKNFFRLETNQTETISSMSVRAPFIWSAGEYMINLFEEGVEAHYYLCPDKINHVTVEYISTNTNYDAILACHDRMIRIVKNGELSSEHTTEGAASCVAIYSVPATSQKDIVFGTINGHLGAYSITPQGIQKKWSRFDPANIGGINSILSVDILHDGSSQIITGRDNGALEIFSFDGTSSVPTLLFQTSLNEMITAIDVGMITNPQHDEIILSTYSGKIMAFSGHRDTDAPPIPTPAVHILLDLYLC